MQSGRVTLAQVAEKAGVSKAAVSLVLNGRRNTGISEETAERIRVAAAELGYVPNPAARALRTGKTNALGFISDQVTVTRYASGVIREVLSQASQRDHVVIMAETESDPKNMDVAVEIMEGRQIDALIVALMWARHVKIERRPAGLPMVVVNGLAEGLPAVLPDEYTAGKQAVEYLLAYGHKKIALIGRAKTHLNPDVSATISQRMGGIDAAMKEAGLTFITEGPGATWRPELGYRRGLDILADTDRMPTAVIAANDRVAFGVYQAAHSLGIRIPHDLSVISFDDEPLADYMMPGVTTLRLPYPEMGRLGVELLLGSNAHPTDSLARPVNAKVLQPDEVFWDPIKTAARYLVPMPLIERESVSWPRDVEQKKLKLSN